MPSPSCDSWMLVKENPDRKKKCLVKMIKNNNGIVFSAAHLCKWQIFVTSNCNCPVVVSENLTNYKNKICRILSVKEYRE